MLDKIWTLAHRGLRHDARLLRLHLLRLGVVTVVMMMVFVAHAGSIATGAPGLVFFSSIVWTMLLFSTVASATFFATAITEEKEEQTLGLLTLANIRPAALILGKFLPRLISACLILTIVFPFTLLAITLGGVLWNQVWAAYWALLAHIVFMGSVGLFFSIVCRTSATAIAGTVLVLLAYFAGVPLLASGLSSFGITSQVSGILYESSAFVRMNRILGTGFGDSAFSPQVINNFAAGLALFIIGWGLFGLCNRNVEGTVDQPSIRERVLRFRRGSRRAWQRALVWKDFYYLAGGPEWFAARCALLLIIGTVFAAADVNFVFDSRFLQSLGTALVLLILWGAIPLELTILAARLFRQEIKEGTWSSLAVLPMSMPRLAYSKLAGGLLGLVPALGCLILGAALAHGSLFDPARPSDLIGGIAGYISFIAFLVLFLHLTTLYSVLFNAWAGVLLALVTAWFSQCFVGPLLLIPVMLLSMSSFGAEWIGMLSMLVVYGTAFTGISIGLQVVIGQQLRSAAGR